MVSFFLPSRGRSARLPKRVIIWGIRQSNLPASTGIGETQGTSKKKKPKPPNRKKKEGNYRSQVFLSLSAKASKQEGKAAFGFLLKESLCIPDRNEVSTLPSTSLSH